MIDKAHYYDRDGIYMYEDDADRFIFFCRATLEGHQAARLAAGYRSTATIGIPRLCQTGSRRSTKTTRSMPATACVYTIHNLAYQGIFGYRVLKIAGVDELRLHRPSRHTAPQ